MNGCYIASLMQTEDAGDAINVKETVLKQIPGSKTTDYILFAFIVAPDGTISYSGPGGGPVARNGAGGICW